MTGGKTLVSGRLLAEITRSLPAKPVDLEVDGPRVSIVCGSARFTLPTMPVEDYPQLPRDARPTSGTVVAAEFAEAVAQTAVAAGRDDTLPMLTGIRVEIEGEKLTLAATDRFRLAVRELSWTPDKPDMSTAVLVPARTLADAAKSLGGSTRGDRRARRRAARPGRRRPPHHRSAAGRGVRQVPLAAAQRTHHHRSTCRPVLLGEAIKRVALVTDRGHHLRMQVSDGSLTLSAGGDDEGSAEEELPAEADGDELLIAFNPSYLLDGLGVIHTDRCGWPSPPRPGRR